MDAIREPLAEALSGIEPRSSSVAFFSTVTGELMDTVGLDAEYWYQSIRQPVQFEQAVRSARDAGHQVFIESSPHPVLIAGIEETLADRDPGDEPLVIPSLGRDDGGLEQVLAVGGPGPCRGYGRGLACGICRRAPGRRSDVCLSAAAVLVAGGTGIGGGIWAAWEWPERSTACWVRWCSGPIRVGWC